MRTLVAAAVASLLIVSLSRADDVKASMRKETSIAAQGLGTALRIFSQERKVHLVFISEDVSLLRTEGASGSLTAEETLRELLKGTGLTYRYIDEKTVTIVPMATQPKSVGDASSGSSGAAQEGIRLARAAHQSQAASGSQAGARKDSEEANRAAKPSSELEEVVVRGAYNYTGTAAVGGKTVQSLREIPQSISVFTRQRLEDQNLTSLPEAMKYTTGVTVSQFDGAGTFNVFYARGYPADSYLLDGLNVRTDANMVDLDLALFERIEVMRGPAGLFQGAGEPGITVSLARKRALAVRQVRTMLSAGSWNAYRGELDVTGALTGSGRVRGRAVAVYDDRDSFLDGVNSQKRLIYATTEFDLGENSTLSIGGTYQDVQAVINQGLPAFPDRLLDVPRSTSIIADWNLQDMQTADVFASLDSDLGNGRLLRIVARRQGRDMHYASLRPNGISDVSGTTTLQQRNNISDKTDSLIDVFFSSPLTLGGRAHNFLIGADYRDSKNDGTNYIAPNLVSNVYTHDSSAFPEPDWILSFLSATPQKEYGVYSQLRLNPAERLKVLLGGRLSWWKSTTRALLDGTSSSYEATSEFTPYAGVVFDINSVLSAYASYSDIFKPQDLFTVNGEHLKPRVGFQYEAGLKGEFMEGQLNMSAALFRLIDKNRALPDPNDANFSVAAGKILSEGAEAEINGKLTSNWSIAAGYAYNKTKYLEDLPFLEGQPYNTAIPKHSLTAWTHYAFAEGMLSGLEVGAGMRAVSKFYVIGPQYTNDYTVFSALLGYRISDRHKLALNVENLFDKKYYAKFGGPSRQNYYGTPLSVMLSLRSQF